LADLAGGGGGRERRRRRRPLLFLTARRPPRGRRGMSEEEERDEETRQMRLELEREQEQYDKWKPKGGGTEEEWTEEWRVRGEEMKRLHALRRRYYERDPQYYQQFKERKKRERLRKGLGLAKGDG
jgi:hypothetical protein